MKEKGITLIALVITIIILIILATVTITLVFGEGGLIQRAQEGKTLTEQAGKDEQDELKGAEEFINGVLAGTTNPPEETTSIEEAKPNPSEDGPKFEDTTTIIDDLDNPVKIPGGFHLDKDSGTKVEEGIVIEDDAGNQFVWIPVGEYNVSTTINSSGKLTNELTRREWADKNVVAEPTPVNGDAAIAGRNVEEYNEYYYGEGNENSVAKDQIEGFKTSSITNKGFYIGRYEQGEGNVCKAGVNPYAEITRDNAKTQAEAMYNRNSYVISELISSYAWDTALNFICQTNEEGYKLATTTDSTYGNIGTKDKTQTGEYRADNYSNIHDFLGNCSEWTTEYSNYSNDKDSFPCAYRVGTYYYDGYSAASRYYGSTGPSSAYGSFRLQLYIKPES